MTSRPLSPKMTTFTRPLMITNIESPGSSWIDDRGVDGDAPDRDACGEILDRGDRQRGEQGRSRDRSADASGIFGARRRAEARRRHGRGRSRNGRTSDAERHSRLLCGRCGPCPVTPVQSTERAVRHGVRGVSRFRWLEVTFQKFPRDQCFTFSCTPLASMSWSSRFARRVTSGGMGRRCAPW